MKKIALTSILVFGIGTAVLAEEATYQIAVTIPAIPGVNVGVVSDEQEQTQAPQGPSPLEVIKDKIIEATGTTVLVTLIER
jgi:hypothetical protein